MPEVVRIYEHGGPEMLKHEQLELRAPGPSEVLVRHTAIGVNFSDVYLRTGLYPRALPSGVGTEAAGIVEQVGRRVREFRPGQRVAYYWGAEPGAYASARIVPADMLLRLPAGVSEEQAAAAMLKGLTSWYLLRQTYRVRRGDVMLVPAAAGGTGLILCQWDAPSARASLVPSEMLPRPRWPNDMAAIRCWWVTRIWRRACAR